MDPMDTTQLVGGGLEEACSGAKLSRIIAEGSPKTHSMNQDSFAHIVAVSKYVTLVYQSFIHRAASTSASSDMCGIRRRQCRNLLTMGSSERHKLGSAAWRRERLTRAKSEVPAGSLSTGSTSSRDTQTSLPSPRARTS
jgi:hypothetical protein